MSKHITIFAIDKNSSKTMSVNVEVTTKEQVKAVYDEFITEVNQVFSKYYVEAMEEDELTDEEKQMLEELDIEIV